MPNGRSGRAVNPTFWLFFGLKGRVSRQVYWLAYALLFTLNGAVMFQFIGGPEMAAAIGSKEATFHRAAIILAPFLIPATIYANIAVSVKRLHDIGYAGFLAVALLIPLVNLVFTVWLGIVPGTTGPNAYGDAGDATT